MGKGMTRKKYINILPTDSRKCLLFLPLRVAIFYLVILLRNFVSILIW